jgi:hypothetical protein
MKVAVGSSVAVQEYRFAKVLLDCVYFAIIRARVAT